MNSLTPLGLFITWTVYGTFLPGDARGWRHRDQGGRRGQPRLQQWHLDRLSHPIVLLDAQMRGIVEDAIREICTVRAWTLWAVAARSNHVHVVVSSPNYKPALVRDQLKANATRELRASFDSFRDRPVWTEKGDIDFLDYEAEIEQCVVYVDEAQDRMDRD